MLKEFKKIMLATSSDGKLREFKELLGNEDDIELVTIKDVFGDNAPAEPEENGKSFADNALIKAKYYSELSKLPCLADDSGMCVDALDGFPGLISKRFCITAENPNPTDEDHNMELIKMLHKKGLTESRAYYECALVLYNAEVNYYYTASGKCYGQYKDQGSGSNGFSFDRYFWPDEYGYNFSLADLVDADKNKISHRGLAVKEMKENMKLNKTYVLIEEKENE